MELAVEPSMTLGAIVTRYPSLAADLEADAARAGRPAAGPAE
jgi:hypothetical protein